MQEKWKDIKGYEGLYQVSNRGNIKSLNYRKGNTSQNLKQEISETGYFRVNLTKTVGGKNFLCINWLRKCSSVMKIIIQK